MLEPCGTVVVFSWAAVISGIKINASKSLNFIKHTLLHSIQFHGQMFAIFRGYQPQIGLILNRGVSLDYVQVAVLRLWEHPGLVLQSLWMAGLQHKFVS